MGICYGLPLDQYLGVLTSLDIFSVDTVNVLIRDCELIMNCSPFGLIEREVEPVPKVVSSATEIVTYTAIL